MSETGSDSGDRPTPKLGEIEVTPTMIEAGVLEAREHVLGGALSELVSAVYMAMALEARKVRELHQ